MPGGARRTDTIHSGQMTSYRQRAASRQARSVRALQAAHGKADARCSERSSFPDMLDFPAGRAHICSERSVRECRGPGHPNPRPPTTRCISRPKPSATPGSAGQAGPGTPAQGGRARCRLLLPSPSATYRLHSLPELVRTPPRSGEGFRCSATIWMRDVVLPHLRMLPAD